MGLLAKVVLSIILLQHLPWCSGYVQGIENIQNNVEEGQRINRQLISGGGRGGARSGSSSSSSNHGSGTASRKAPHQSTGNDKSYGSGTASKKSAFTPYGAVYAAGAANHHNNNNNNHRNMAAPLSCNGNNIGLLLTIALIVAILLVVASS